MRWKRIRPHLDFLYDLALRETGRPQDAEDVVQDVAASALRAEEPRMPRAWLAGAVLRRARHVHRGESRRRVRETVAGSPGAGPPPDRAALVRDEVEHALASLAPEERRAVVLRHLHDLGYAEIGQALGVTPGAARQRVHRALARLRGRFGADTEMALALLPLLAAPRPLFAKPLVTGAILMKTSTKAALILLALGAGAATGVATIAPPAAGRAPAAAAPVHAPRGEDELPLLRARLERYPRLDDADALVYADTSLRTKLAGLDALPEKKRGEAVARLGKQLHETGRGLDEALSLLRSETDRRVLFWLASLLYNVTIHSDRISDETRDSLAPLAVRGDPAERRRAAVALAVGTRYQKATPVWETTLHAVLERETDPAVLAMAADVLTFVFLDEPAPALLGAWRRMPAGADRRNVAVRYHYYVPFAEVVARYDEARDDGERADWRIAIGYKLGEAKPEEVDATLGRVYAETPDARTRAWLALNLLNFRPVGDCARLVPLETDATLRALLETIVARSLSHEDARALLKEYRGQ